MIVATARTAAELLAPCFAEGGEAVAVLLLDSEQRLLATTRPGPETEADLPLRAILAAALEAGAASMIVARSRAREDPAPTDEDRASARLLAEAAAAAGVRLADYFSFAGTECLSFRDLGLL
jgi:DNA repair protein RadC